MAILDTSAAIHLALNPIDDSSDDVVRQLMEDQRFVAPSLLRTEAAQVAWKYVHAGHLDHGNAAKLMEAAIGYVDEFVDDRQLVREAFNEAVRLNHPLYDMLFFVLARRTGTPLLTCDHKLAKLCCDNNVECVILVNL